MNPEEEYSYLNQKYETAKTRFIIMTAPILAICFIVAATYSNEPKAPADLYQGVLVEQNQQEGWASFRQNGQMIRIAVDNPVDQAALVVGKTYAVTESTFVSKWGKFISYHFKEV